MAEPTQIVIECTLDELPERVERLVEEYQLQRNKDIGTFYIMPEQEVIERAARRPQILMFFQQLTKELTENFPRPVVGRISCRIMNRETTTITTQDLELYANRIKTLFGGETPFIWERGKESYSYTDQIKGYRMKIIAKDRQAAKKVVEQVLDIQSHTPDWELFNNNSPDNPDVKYDETPGVQTILNKPYKKKRRRPRCTLQILKAEIFIDGIAGNTLLYDHSTGYVYKPPAA